MDLRARKVHAGPEAMASIDEWCDEATFVNWHQSDARLPERDAAYERLIADGMIVDLPHSSVDNAARAFPHPAFTE